MSLSKVYRRTCTHTTMTRLFDTDGMLRCNLCGQPPVFGWVYACTEDSDRFLPKEGWSCTSIDDNLSEETEPALSSWITQAIEDGHYTAEQVQTIKEQRSNALQAMKAGRNSRTWSAPDEVYASQPPNSDSRDMIARKIDEMFVARQIPPQPSRVTGASIPVCQLRTCHRCNPASQDRSWMSLNAVCSGNYMKDRLNAETFERTVADVNYIPHASPLLHEVDRWSSIFERLQGNSPAAASSSEGPAVRDECETKLRPPPRTRKTIIDLHADLYDSGDEKAPPGLLRVNRQSMQRQRGPYLPRPIPLLPKACSEPAVTNTRRNNENMPALRPKLRMNRHQSLSFDRGRLVTKPNINMSAMENDASKTGDGDILTQV